MKTVRELLEEKGREVRSIGPDATVYDALKLMADQEIGSLVVLEGGRAAGIITERDYARSVILKGRASKDTRVREIMTSRPVCATPDQTAEECMAVMTEKRVRHLPVIEGDELVGLVSIGDLVKSIISEQQFIIKQLEHYISG
jgi:CBS domain-containing protein